MAEIKSQPTNKNFLSPFGFKFFLKKTPNVNWFVQSINLPSISIQNTIKPNPFIKIPLTGDHIDFGELKVSFRVDEDMKNYLEIYNWLIGIGFPDKFDQYKSIAPKINRQITGDADVLTGTSIYSDATLMILSSNMNPLTEITFVDTFPVSLSDLQFNSTLTDVQYILAEVTFIYRKFDIKSL
jgi:hypothetical protein